MRIVAEEAASPEDFSCAVLDVSLLLFPEVKAYGYLTWLAVQDSFRWWIHSTGAALRTIEFPFLRWAKGKGFDATSTPRPKECDFHTFPAWVGLMALWVAMPAVFSARYSIPFCTQSPRNFPVTFTVNLKRSHNHFPCAKVV